MDDLTFWHKRYQEQASWTQELRQKLCETISLPERSNILEVGSGTGVVISEINQQIHPHLAVGLELDWQTVKFAKNHSKIINYISGNGISLPFPDSFFDLTFVHFVLLWIDDPVGLIKEMVRATKKGGLIAIFAEPDYGGRIDYPELFEPTGMQQTKSLIAQGIDPFCGRKIADILYQAGIKNITSGIYGSQWHSNTNPADSTEWEVLKADTNNLHPETTSDQQKDQDQKFRELGTRVLFIPTFYSYGYVA